MAIAWVANSGVTYGIAGSSSTITSSTGAAVSTGDAIVVFVTTISTAGYQTVSSITDTAGNNAKYALCGSRYQYLLSSTYYVNTECWVAPNITGHAANYITANYSTANAASYIMAGSWSGMALSGAYDTGYDPAGNVDATSTYTTTADTTAEDNEIIIGFFLSLVATSQTKSSSSPSVLRYVAPEATQTRCIVDNVAEAAGSFSVSVASTVNEAHICFAKAFKQAAAGVTMPIFSYHYMHH